MGKARKDKERRKARREAARKAALASPPVVIPIDQDGSDGGPVRPTLRQLAAGDYRLPVGPKTAERPALNLKPDCVAALMVAPAHLTADQHDAARDWQELRWEVKAEIGAREGRSCLDIGPVGHDGGDGNPALAARWRKVRTLLGPAKVALLDRTCVDGAWPRDLTAFRAALDAFASIVTGRLTAAK